MPLSLGFVVRLALALAAIAYAVVPLVDRLTFQWFVRDLDARGALIAQTAQEPLSELMRDPRGSRARVQRYFERIMQGERIFAIGLCDRTGTLAIASPTFPQALRCPAPEQRETRSWVLQLRDGPLHVSANPVAGDAGPLGQLIIVHDMSFVERRRADTKKYVLWRFAGSAMVTALEPIVRACSGTWIAHGAGNAERDPVDKNDHVMVPPEHPAYRIRRVWLSPEEEQGYYYGFANEGLWPLCHIAHTRPTFRAADWEHYQNVNRRFAEIVAAEARTEDPIILVQDYHFALLPRMVRERLPRATIITFWHIPWPNPEAFGILPWREEILDGMLGSSILGFHTQFHCNNFFDTVDRFLEARVDRETFPISYGGDTTEVRRYPISIEWPPAALQVQVPVPEARARVRERLGIPPDVKLGVGVDRLDYTKGILERFTAIQRLFELEPRWSGQFACIQGARTSRSSLDEYQNLHPPLPPLPPHTH